MLRTAWWPCLALALVLSGCAAGTRTSAWGVPSRVFRAASHRPPPRAARPTRPAHPAAALVERHLHERGLRFGTDGTIGALYGYLHDNGRRVSPGQARPGDVVFFYMGDGTDQLEEGPSCEDHVGLVEAVDTDGRIAFREVREGSVHRSYVHAAAPSARRDGQGRILNTFLRAKRPADSPTTTYFAGEMLCAVLRPPGR